MIRQSLLKLDLNYRPLKALRPNPRNARTHSKRQVRLIADSLKTFGCINPVLIDDHDMVVAGHGRLEAAKLLGLPDVPTIRIDHLSDDQKRAYVLADNQLAARAGWDPEILAIELQHLSEVVVDFEVTVTGFEVPQIDLIIEGASDKPKDRDEVEPIDRSRPPVSAPEPPTVIRGRFKVGVLDAFLIAAGKTDRIAASSVRAARLSLAAALHSLDKYADEAG